VADSGALRQRRSAAHKAGDHRLCNPARCPHASAVARLHPVPPVPGPDAVDAMEGLTALARRLQAAHEAEPGNALLARELRMTLQALLPAARPAVDGDLASLFEELSG
jgi:hypothetical protein